jgi:aldose sugar dehydrogenase
MATLTLDALIRLCLKSTALRLAVGFLAGQRVEVLDLDEAGMTTSHTRLDLPRQRIRALVPDPHGALYIAVDAGAIWRVAPQTP